MYKAAQFAALFLQAFLSKHKKQLLGGAIVGFFTTLFLIQIYPLYVQLIGKKHYSIGLVGNFTQNFLPPIITEQISIGLTALTASGEATASAAEGWDIDKSGTNYTFHLSPNLKWHDGRKFSAKDINYRFSGVTFSALDDFTLKATLKEPFAPILVLLSTPLLRDRITGLGPYQIVQLKTGDEQLTQLTLKSNTNLPILTYKFYKNISQAILGFEMGEVDKLQDIIDPAELTHWKSLKITPETQYNQYIALFLNLKNSLFKEKEIRQALAYAMPDFPGKEKVHSPLSPYSWAYSKNIRLYNYDSETAGKILAKSPLASASAALTLSTFYPYLSEAETVAQSLREVGLNIKVKIENNFNPDYQMFLMARAIPPDPDQYPYWQSTQDATNISHYNNQKIDKLLEVGRTTLDKEARKKIYADFQRYLVDDAPVIFLYYPKLYTVERK